jgi:hypothetical protein
MYRENSVVVNRSRYWQTSWDHSEENRKSPILGPFGLFLYVNWLQNWGDRLLDRAMTMTEQRQTKLIYATVCKHKLCGVVPPHANPCYLCSLQIECIQDSH